MVNRTLSYYILFLITLLPVFGFSESLNTPILLNDNGGWCWFQDERAILDGDQLLFGSVSSPEGDVEITAFDLVKSTTQSIVLHKQLQSDDHCAPALLRLPDGRILAVYAKHGSDRFMRWRITKKAGDISAWSDEKQMDVGAGDTYSNLFQLSAENGRIYNFHRGVNWNPNYMLSNDDGKSWIYGGHLLKWDGRPYVKYTSNHRDTIHFITTEHHPHNYPNSIYHGFIRGGVVYRSDGTTISDLSHSKQTNLLPTDLTKVFAGDKNQIAWTIDIQLDRSGNPYIVFSVRKNQNIKDHRYYYGRWDGKAWNVHEMAYAGTNLYKTEMDYTGLAALDPNDPDVVYISADVNPTTGKALISQKDNKPHYEIFKGDTTDKGEHWNWTAITHDSTSDNLRPIIPEGNRTVLLWLTGEYRSYIDYDLDVVGMVME